MLEKQFTFYSPDYFKLPSQPEKLAWQLLYIGKDLVRLVATIIVIVMNHCDIWNIKCKVQEIKRFGKGLSSKSEYKTL